jgi:hypothetical protein
MKTRYCEIIGTTRQGEQFKSALDGSLDNLIERIEAKTGLCPDPLHFTIRLVDFSDDILAQMNEWYPGHYFPQCPGYTDNERKTILFAVHNLKRRVIIHELTHMILNLYFTEKRVPKELHEIIAQTMEELIK